MVLKAKVSNGTLSSELDFEWMRTTPSVSVTAHSVALDDLSGAAIEVTTRNGVATFVARDESGRPIPGARVSLDGGEAKTTDAQGRVSFAYTASVDAFGRKTLHEIVIEVPGHDTQRLFIPL
jgi:hypothetical protein